MFLSHRVHLYPFRTQKLSCAEPKILAWRRAGKIGQCQHLDAGREPKRQKQTAKQKRISVVEIFGRVKQLKLNEPDIASTGTVVGVFIAQGPPVPIPNTEVKLCGAEDTCLATDRENRSTPTSFLLRLYSNTVQINDGFSVRARIW